MWALIRSNRRRTVMLVISSLCVMALAGYLVAGIMPRVGSLIMNPAAAGGRPPLFSPMAGLLGVEIAVLVWLFVTVVACVQGDRILLAAAGARALEQEDHPQFYHVVEEMSLAASLPRVPRPHVIDDPSLNAFAAGISPQRAAIAVTAGALATLTRDELQGVVAHEIAHIANSDILFMTVACLFTGAARGGALSPPPATKRRRFAVRAGAVEPRVSLLHTLLRRISAMLALLAPVSVIPVLFGVARRRDYLADACAALYTRYPEGLASALYVMAGDTRSVLQRNPATATLYTVNPYRKEMGVHTPLLLAITHAPAQQRIAILRSIHTTVSLAAYERAWQRATGRASRLLPRRADPGPAYSIRGPADVPAAGRVPKHGVLDCARRMHRYTFLSCACGMHIKLPPDYPADQILCPRCARMVRKAEGTAPQPRRAERL